MSKEATAVFRMFLLHLMFCSAGCQLMKTGGRSELPTMKSRVAANGIAINPEQQNDRPKIEIELRNGAGTVATEFQGRFVSLGNVVAKLSPNAKQEVVALHRNSKVIFLPTYFATNTDASKIVVEDGDTVELTTWSASPIGSKDSVGEPDFKKTTEYNSIASRLESFGHPKGGDIDSGIFDAVIKSKTNAINSNPENVEENKKKLSEIAELKLLKAKYNSILDKQSSYTLSGLIQNNGKFPINDFQLKMDSLISAQTSLAIVNGIPANIIVLSRGDTITVLPFRSELNKSSIPDAIKKSATDAWTDAAIKNRDVYQFTRLSLFAPVVDGKKKEAAEKIRKALLKVEKTSEETATNLIRSASEKYNKSEPGFIQKALKAIPTSIPRLSVPGFRLPVF